MKLRVFTGLAILATCFATVATAHQPEPKEYAIFFSESKSSFEDRTNSNAKTYWKTWTAYIGGLQASGKMTGGSALVQPTIGTKISQKGEAKLDEAKLHLSGFVTIKADSYTDAVKIAKESPAIAEGGTVEVREILPMSQHSGEAR